MKTLKKLLDNFKKSSKRDSDMSDSSLVAALPNEVWFYLCTFLPAREFVQLCSTCKELNQYISDEYIWKMFALRDCNLLPMLADTTSIMNNVFGTYNMRNLFDRSWQWIYRSKMVDIQQEKGDMIHRTYLVGHRTTKGGKYEGEWKLGKLDGIGTLCNSTGDMVYLGEFKQSEVHGRGVCLFSDGTRYEGEWKGSEAHGKGTCWYLDGKRYQGRWKEGKRCGNGTFYWKNGSYYAGKWKNDKPAGKGTHYCSATNTKQRCEWTNEFTCCCSDSAEKGNDGVGQVAGDHTTSSFEIRKSKLHV